MWVILLTKLSCEVSPPKLSIFWATPWPLDKYVKSQCVLDEEGQPVKCPGIKTWAHNKNSGELEPNWNGARRIRYSDHDVRIFPHEFNEIPTEKLKFYLDNEMYDLVSEGVASDQIITDIMEGDNRVLWEHALVDGCNDSQARMVAMGIDVTLPDAIIPPVGWYRCREEFAVVFCHDHELKEHRKVPGDEVPNEDKPVAKRGRKRKDREPTWMVHARNLIKH